MKTFRSHVRLGAVSLPTGFESSTGGKLSVMWQGILITVATQAAPWLTVLIAKSGVQLSQEQAITLIVTLSIVVYGALRKLLMKYAQIELPEVNPESQV